MGSDYSYNAMATILKDAIRFQSDFSYLRPYIMSIPWTESLIREIFSTAVSGNLSE